MSWSTLRAGATSSTSSHRSIRSTLPTARRCVTPPVPVTTTWSSCVVRCASAKSAVVSRRASDYALRFGAKPTSAR
jgi:hypothetical protein